MATQQFSAVLRFLDGFGAGDWLAKALDAEDVPPPRPHVWVTESSPNEIARAIPTGLQLDPSWLVLASADPSAAERITDADALVWGMPALRMFPAEASNLLRAVQRERIMTLVIVVGVGALDDPAKFSRAIATTWLPVLPRGSHIITDPHPQAEAHAWIGQHAPACVASRARRRQSQLQQQLREHVVSERNELLERVKRGDYALDLAQSTASALRAQFAAQIGEALERLRAMLTEITRFERDVVPSLVAAASEAVADEGEPVDSLARTIEMEVEAWVTNKLVPIDQHMFAESQQALIAWGRRLTEGIHDGFAPLCAEAQDAALDSAVHDVAFADTFQAIQQRLEAVNSAILAAIEASRATLGSRLARDLRTMQEMADNQRAARTHVDSRRSVSTGQERVVDSTLASDADAADRFHGYAGAAGDDDGSDASQWAAPAADGWGNADESMAKDGAEGAAQFPVEATRRTQISSFIQSSRESFAVLARQYQLSMGQERLLSTLFLTMSQMYNSIYQTLRDEREPMTELALAALTDQVDPALARSREHALSYDDLLRRLEEALLALEKIPS